MKKGIVIISLILMGITVFRVWRIQETHSLAGIGKASVNAFPPIPPADKWVGVPPVPSLNAVFDIIPEKEKTKETTSTGIKAVEADKIKLQNAGKPKSLPKVFGIFSQEGNSYALIENKTQKAETKVQGGAQSNKQSQPGYLVIPEGGEVETWVLAEILPTRLLFKVEGEEDHFITLFKYDKKPLKGK